MHRESNTRCIAVISSDEKSLEYLSVNLRNHKTYVERFENPEDCIDRLINKNGIHLIVFDSKAFSYDQGLEFHQKLKVLYEEKDLNSKYYQQIILLVEEETQLRDARAISISAALFPKDPMDMANVHRVVEEAVQKTQTIHRIKSIESKVDSVNFKVDEGNQLLKEFIEKMEKGCHLLNGDDKQSKWETLESWATFFKSSALAKFILFIIVTAGGVGVYYMKHLALVAKVVK